MRNWSAVLNTTVATKGSRRSSSTAIEPPPWDSVDVPDSVRSRLVEECEAMARHALGAGNTPPGWVLEAIEQERTDTDRRASVILQAIDEPQNGEASSPARAPRPIVSAAPATGFDELVRAHSTLSRLIAPATPRGILLLSRGHREGRLKALGPVRLIRQMLVVVIVMLVMFVVLAISPDVNSTSGDIFKSSGIPLLFNELFYIAAGGLGAAFYALFTAYRYIAEGTYDTTYESSYWIRFILGLIAGVLLPSLIPISSNGTASVRRPLLALLGGFSAALLYRILQRFVQTVEALAEGDSRPVEMAKTQAAAARAMAQVGEDRLVLVGDLVRLRDGLTAGESPDHLKASIDKLLVDLVPRGVVPESTDAPRRPDPS